MKRLINTKREAKVSYGLYTWIIVLSIGTLHKYVGIQNWMQVLEMMSKSNKEVVHRYERIADTLAKEPTNSEEATSLRK